MAKSIATVHGTAITPGVSKNGRRYSRELLGKAVARAAPRVAEGAASVRDLRELAQRTHHAAADDSTRIVGRLTSLTQDGDGAVRYTAELANTDHARTILELIDTTDGQPAFLSGVSIRGAWIGPVRRVRDGDGYVETADDLEIYGLDYTQTPGVTGARIDRVERHDDTAPVESEDRVLIYESVQEALVTEVEPVVEKGAPALKSGKAATAQTKAKNYADPGYQDDKMPRYPLDSRDQTKAAWSYIGMPKNAKLYTANQLKRVKQRITKALRGFGVKVDTTEGWVITPALAVSEAVAEMDMWPDEPGNFCVSISNGMVSISVSSWRVDPADLEMAARAAMEGACQALKTIDPDDDGDIDDPDSEVVDSTESADPDGSVAEATTDTPTTGEIEAAPDQAAEPHRKEPDAMSDATTPAAEGQPNTTTPDTPAAASAPPAAPVGPSLSDEQFQQYLARIAPQPALAAAAAETAPPAAAPTQESVTPAAPAAVQETDEQRVERLVEEKFTKRLQEAVASGQMPVQRKGLVAGVAETVKAAAAGDVGSNGLPSNWPDKPLHEYTDEEWKRNVRPTTATAVLGARSGYTDQT